jgi:hypothetical protein
LQYWSSLSKTDKQIINGNVFLANSTIQKTNRFVLTEQISSNTLRDSSSTVAREFKVILSLNSVPKVTSPARLTVINSESNSSTALKKSRLKRFHHSVYQQKPSNHLKNITSSSCQLIYLVQTEICLADYLLQSGLFGDGCQNDILVLSWKKPCTSHFSLRFKHIQYIYKANTTWSTGRNMLYHLAKKIPKSYLYYIFMDDDIRFNFTSSAFEERYRSIGILWPLQAFEDFLLKYEPAIGMPLYCSRCLRMNKITGKPETICCDRVKNLKPLPEYLPFTIHFDAAFNAFHKNAVDHILPYRLEHEHRSWWQSQKFVIIASELMFRGQALRFFPVAVFNEKHRAYPREDWDNWSNIYNILKEEMPEKYRKHFKWTPSYSTINVVPRVINNTVFTPMWNVEIPRGKITVEPFKHLKN